MLNSSYTNFALKQIIDIQYMKLNNFLTGLGVALITPYKTDGQVDYEKLEELTEFQISNGANFLCVLGTTAETPCLTQQEKRDIIQTVSRVNAGRTPLLLGAGSNCTSNVISYIQQEVPKEIDAVLLVAPYYNKPSQEGLYMHYKTISENCPFPIVLYNVPGRTGVNIEAETTLKIARNCSNVIAIKEASGNITQIENIIQNAPEGFEVISGDDAITFELLTLGAKGVISVVGNAYPREFSEMVHSALNGDLQRALEIHRKFTEIYPLLGIDGNPSGIKSLLSVQERINNILRLPLVPARQSTQQALENFINSFK